MLGMSLVFMEAITSRHELALYNRIYEGPGLKEYLRRHSNGQ